MKRLTVEHLASGYEQHRVLHDISFVAHPNETTVIMGPSGSGKTTLLLTILGIIGPQTGRVLLGNRNMTHEPIETRHIGYLPQDYGLFPHMSVLDNVSYGLRVWGVPKQERYKIAKDMLSLVEMDEYADRRIAQLSGGQRQRVGLARALAIKPDLLLLDEPLSNIDQVTKLDVAKGLIDLFKKLDIPILLVTHNYEDAHWFAKHLIVLINGQIAQEGTFQTVKESPRTEFIKRLIMPFSGHV
ncbi:ABC transporter ATP-binding protein [Candidatus Peregrinibacteria bacterium]|nr:ABC transporter ATP-binding protein [Candidatus Peregrinibacteria bacterium]